MTILYLHGLYSRPGGFKPTYLKDQGFTVVNPGMPDGDFDESTRIAQHAHEASRPNVVVGSSRGGAVAINIDTGTTPVVLIAPAWRRWGRATRATSRTVIIHSPGDRVVDLEDSRTLLAASGLPESALWLRGIDHDMVDPDALDALVSAVRQAVGGAPSGIE